MKSIFYATDKITKTIIKKARNSYKKDIAYEIIYNGLENKNFVPEKLPLNAPFVEKKKNIRATLYSFNGPFQALQAAIVYISF